jgi:hypothetical protein
MRAVFGVLGHQIGKVARRRVQPVGQQRADQPQQLRIVAEEGFSVLDDIDAGAPDRAHSRGMRAAEQDRHFAEHRSRLVASGDLRLPAEHREAPLGEHIDPPGRLPLLQQHRSIRDIGDGHGGAMIKDCPHQKCTAG